MAQRRQSLEHAESAARNNPNHGDAHGVANQELHAMLLWVLAGVENPLCIFGLKPVRHMSCSMLRYAADPGRNKPRHPWPMVGTNDLHAKGLQPFLTSRPDATGEHIVDTKPPHVGNGLQAHLRTTQTAAIGRNAKWCVKAPAAYGWNLFNP